MENKEEIVYGWIDNIYQLIPKKLFIARNQVPNYMVAQASKGKIAGKLLKVNDADKNHIGYVEESDWREYKEKDERNN